MATIAWHEFSWEAFATLMTGMAAVAGALVIGMRQVGITDRQSKILERQVGLDELRLKSELFEKRYEVYDAALRFLIDASAGGHQPHGDVERRFLRAIEASRFLFDDEVHAHLKKIEIECVRLWSATRSLEGDMNLHGSYSQSHIDQQDRGFRVVGDLRSELHTIFEDKLGLEKAEQS